jgi:hypothetical protein
MNHSPSTKPRKEKIRRLVAGILLLSWLVLGNGGLGLASTAHSPLEIQGDRITGVLMQVPLRTVLARIQEKLAIEYVVPEEELDRLVSANLTGEPVIKSLSKILASWDYALQVDHLGRVHQIFVVAKAKTIEIEKNDVKTVENEPVSEAFTSRALLSGTEMTSNPESVNVPNSEWDVMASPMGFVPSEESPPMVIQPPQGRSMNIQPPSNLMEVIPASGTSLMDISPVSEDEQMEFIESHN